MLLELIRPEPAWEEALGVALLRPPGVPERRAGEDPWSAADDDRPRRVADDLAWLRVALDRPDDHGLRVLVGTAAVGVWEPEEACSERLHRLRDRGVLEAAGFLLHDSDEDA